MAQADKDTAKQTRRDFILRGGVGALVIGTGLLLPVSHRHALMDHTRGEKLDAVLSDQNPTSIAALLRDFHGASQPDLMRRHVSGFTPVVLVCMATDANGRHAKLEEAKKRPNNCLGR
jgi:hypothetical protein